MIAMLLLVVKVGIVVALAALAALALRRAPAASRHLAWTLAFAAMLALPLGSALMPSWRIPVRGLVASKPALEVDAAPARASSDLAAASLAGSPMPEPRAIAVREAAGPGSLLAALRPWWTPLALLAWVAGTLVALARLGRDLALARGLIRRGASSVGQDQVDELARDLGLTRSPRLLESAEASVPMTFGALRPVVIVPTGFAGWHVARRREVLLHELAHVGRQDWALSLLARVATALFWFHPLVRLAERRLRAEAEQAADDVVLARGTRASSYATHLLGFVRPTPSPERSHPFSRSTSMTLSMIGGPLDRRIHAVLDSTRDRGPVSFSMRVALGAGALAVVLACSAVDVQADPAPRSTWERMSDHVHELFETTPTTGDGWYIRGLRLHERERFTEAIECWQKAIAAGDAVAASTYNIACAQARLGREQQALDSLEAAIEAGFDASEYLYSDDDLASLRGKPRFEALVREHGDESVFEKPRQELARLRAEGSKDADALHRVGSSLLSAGDDESAIEALRLALAADPSSQNTAYNLACAYAQAGRKAEALDALDQAAALGFGGAEHAATDRDLLPLHGEARFDVIVEDMRALELPGRMSFFGHSMGIDEDEWKEARERHQGYLERHPASGHAWSNLGYIQLGLNAPDAARAAYEQAQKLGYSPGQTAYNLACAQARGGQIDAAFASLERASSLGFEMGGYLESDSDLEALRADSRFADLQRRHPSRMHSFHDHIRRVLAL